MKLIHTEKCEVHDFLDALSIPRCLSIEPWLLLKLPTRRLRNTKNTTILSTGTILSPHSGAAPLFMILQAATVLNSLPRRMQLHILKAPKDTRIHQRLPATFTATRPRLWLSFTPPHKRRQTRPPPSTARTPLHPMWR